MVVVGSLGPGASSLTVVHFPPVMCSKDGGSFYGSVLPATIITAITISMLVIIGWAIHQVNWSVYHQNMEEKAGIISMSMSFLQQKAYKAEMKLTIVYAYFLIFVLMGNFQEAIRIVWRESFKNATNSYFLCEAVGHVPGRCSRETIEQYSYQYSLLNCLTNIMAFFIPVVNLMFVINCRIVRERTRKLKIMKTKTSSIRTP